MRRGARIAGRLAFVSSGAVLLVLAPSACGSGPSLNRAVEDHLRKAPPDGTVVGATENVKSVRCFSTDLNYQHHAVYSCDATYTSGDTTDICVARIKGEIVTNRDNPRLPCIAHSEPVPPG
jgi:hypothetical protein